MCYHISNTKKKARELEDRFNATFEFPEAYEPYYHFNGWELKNLYIVRQEDPQSIDVAKWGHLPEGFQLNDRKEFLARTNTLNATKERLFESHLFSNHIKWNRCLIIADGLYEPHKVAGMKGSFPYYFRYHNQELFAFAGIYSEIIHDTKPIFSASIITTEANPLFKEIHNSPNNKGSYRMPLILDKQDEWDWLHCNDDTNRIESLLNTFTKEEIAAYPVSKDLFSRKVDSNRADILEQINYPELNSQGSLF
jgi:putative SOS response-associated peptidase YedK